MFDLKNVPAGTILFVPTGEIRPPRTGEWFQAADRSCFVVATVTLAYEKPIFARYTVDEWRAKSEPKLPEVGSYWLHEDGVVGVVDACENGGAAVRVRWSDGRAGTYSAVQFALMKCTRLVPETKGGAS